jgi:sortase B
MKNNKRLLIAILCVAAVGIIPPSQSMAASSSTVKTIEKNTEEASEETDVLTELGITVPDKKLDWEALEKQNSDIYAWIYIPNTKVDYPILQHATDLTYYLNYNIDGTKGYPGCIYSQYYNAKYFNDPNTILYGHNMKNGSMFRTLHYFEDKDFFEDNPYIYVYTPEETYVYEIYSANIVSNEHLMHAYDFWTTKGFNSFVTNVGKAASKICHVRKDAKPASGDCLLTLSTCLGQADKRWIVVGKRLN